MVQQHERTSAPAHSHASSAWLRRGRGGVGGEPTTTASPGENTPPAAAAAASAAGLPGPPVQRHQCKGFCERAASEADSSCSSTDPNLRQPTAMQAVPGSGQAGGRAHHHSKPEREISPACPFPVAAVETARMAGLPGPPVMRNQCKSMREGGQSGCQQCTHIYNHSRITAR